MRSARLIKGHVCTLSINQSYSARRHSFMAACCTYRRSFSDFHHPIGSTKVSPHLFCLCVWMPITYLWSPVGYLAVWERISVCFNVRTGKKCRNCCVYMNNTLHLTSIIQNCGKHFCLCFCINLTTCRVNKAKLGCNFFFPQVGSYGS